MSLPSNRQAALAYKRTHYFTGVECANGHLAARLASSCHCVECNSEKVETFRRNNPERYREINAQSYARNRDRNYGENR